MRVPDESLPAAEPGEDTGGSSPAVNAPRVGFARGRAGFESEWNGYRQQRLGLCALVLGAVGGALLPLHSLLNAGSGAGVPEFYERPATWIHLVGVLYMFCLWWFLRGRRRSGRLLDALDTLMQLAVVGACVLIYLSNYAMGNPSLVACLGLFLLTRAVVVPSRAWRTALGCLPAPPAILAIQLSHGWMMVWPGVQLPPEAFVKFVSWDFVFLTLCGIVATVASRVNFRLRLSAYEARQLDQYVLEGLIGKGAMGEVHRARHALMRRPTAIKLVRSEMMSERLLKRFQQEVRHTSRLTHPNTIRVFDYGQTSDGVFYYAMELLDGADLERLVKATGPLSPARVIHVLIQALGALEEAHAVGLVHRDVKPSNLLLCRQGLAHDVVKVMDFGLVRDTESTEPSLSSADEICGSPQTIAPEVLKGAKATPAADLYALGAVGCYLLTGKPIFDAGSVMEFVVSHLQRPPIMPSERGVSVPADLEAALLACLAKDPADRPADAATLRTRLLACEHAGRWTDAEAGAWWAAHGAGLAPVASEET